MREDFLLHLSNRATQHVAITPAQSVLAIDAVHDMVEFLFASADLRKSIADDKEEDQWKEHFKEDIDLDEFLDSIHAIVKIVLEINDNNRSTNRAITTTR